MTPFKIKKIITERSSDSIARYFKEINKFKVLSPEEEQVLLEKVHSGDKEALDTLIKANLKFVVSVAKQYQNHGLDLADLINEGNIGLMHAISLFNKDRKIKFISYAVWWIRQSILLALSSLGKEIRIPTNQIQLLSKYKKFINQFEQENERPPEIKEIANYLNISEENVLLLQDHSIKLVSLNTPVENDPEYTIESIIEESLLQPDTTVNDESLHTDLEKVLEDLEEQDKTIINDYFGFNTTTKSIDFISEKFNISPERVKQIVNTAINKLRTNKNIKFLSKYLG